MIQANGHKKYSLFIGRWQPFHKGHKYIIDTELEKGHNIAIAVRDVPVSETDPFSIEDRIEIIKKIYEHDVNIARVVVFPIVDIASVNIGRNVGYDIQEADVPENIMDISATEIRKRMVNGENWEVYVPQKSVEVIREKLFVMSRS